MNGRARQIIVSDRKSRHDTTWSAITRQLKFSLLPDSKTFFFRGVGVAAWEL